MGQLTGMAYQEQDLVPGQVNKDNLTFNLNKLKTKYIEPEQTEQ